MALFVYADEDKPEDKRWFRCVSCGKVGNHQYLWKVLTGNTVAVIPGAKRTQKFLPHWSRWEERYGSIENLVQKAHDNVTIFPSTHAWYIKKRELMPVYKLAKLGYIEEWLIFPIFDPQGKIVDVIARDTKGRSKYVIHPNDEDTPLLYVPSWDRVMASKTIFIVYGLIDALALEYVIVPDRGEEVAARKLSKSLGNFTRVIRLPWSELGDDVKDPDSLRMKFGLEHLKNLLIGENK
jgi:hypothetical protein